MMDDTERLEARKEDYFRRAGCGQKRALSRSKNWNRELVSASVTYCTDWKNTSAEVRGTPVKSDYL